MFRWDARNADISAVEIQEFWMDGDHLYERTQYLERSTSLTNKLRDLWICPFDIERLLSRDWGCVGIFSCRLSVLKIKFLLLQLLLFLPPPPPPQSHTTTPINSSSLVPSFSSCMVDISKSLTFQAQFGLVECKIHKFEVLERLVTLFIFYKHWGQRYKIW